MGSAEMAAMIPYKEARKRFVRRANVPVEFVAEDIIRPVEYHGSAPIHACTRADGIIAMPVGTAEIPEAKRPR